MDTNKIYKLTACIKYIKMYGTYIKHYDVMTDDEINNTVSNISFNRDRLKTLIYNQ